MLLLLLCLSIAVADLCDVNIPGYKCAREVANLVQGNEGLRTCMYLDGRNLKTIGVGYCMQYEGINNCTSLHQIERDFGAVGIDTTAVIASTPRSKDENKQIYCYAYCSKAPKGSCITPEQACSLFSNSLKEKMNIVIKQFPGLQDVCCNAFAVITDMTYNGYRVRERYSLFSDLIGGSQWSAAAANLLQCHTHESGLCVNSRPDSRCMKLYNLLSEGCGCSTNGCPVGGTLEVCSGPSPNNLYDTCRSNKGTCCPYGQACNNGYGEMFEYPGHVCDSCESKCCQRNNKTIGSGCCASATPVCCKDIRGCCAKSNPVCCVEQKGCCMAGSACCGTAARGWCCEDGGACTPTGCKWNGAETPGIPLEIMKIDSL